MLPPELLIGLCINCADKSEPLLPDRISAVGVIYKRIPHGTVDNAFVFTQALSLTNELKIYILPANALHQILDPERIGGIKLQDGHIVFFG